MQERLSRDPYGAMGLTGTPTPAAVRTAFLSLTKQFHPAKFARMSPEVQRFSNEVFLALRAVHDQLSRPSVAPRPSPGSSTGPQRAIAGAPPIASGTGPPPTGPTGPQRIVPSAPVSSASASGTGPRSVPVGASATRAPSAQGSQAMRPTTSSGPNPPVTTEPPRRPSSPSLPAVRTAAASGPRAVVPPGPATQSPGTNTGLAPILELLRLGQLAAGRAALEASPNRTPHAQALLHYARGREAQLAKRIDDARVELQDALALDPDLQLAKTALAELFTRRK
jgi:hypothetical protein